MNREGAGVSSGAAQCRERRVLCSHWRRIVAVVSGQKDPADLAGTLGGPLVDLHSHILPGFDDGATDLAASVEIARAAVQDGTRCMVATPHVSLAYDATPSAIAAGTAVLTDALAERGIDLEVAWGAEVAVPRLFELDDHALRELCLGRGTYLLVESPYSAAPFLEEILFDLRTRGFRPLLAHPERCPTFQRDRGLLERLVGQGALCSITAGSLTGTFGRTVQRFTRDLFRAGLVHDISSDAHNTLGRPPGLTAGLDALNADLPELAGQTDGTPVKCRVRSCGESRCRHAPPWTSAGRRADGAPAGGDELAGQP